MLGAASDATACPHDMPLTPQVPRAGRLTRVARTTAALVALCVPSLAMAQREGEGLGNAKPFAAFSNSAMSLRDSIVAVARAQIGTPYRLGGTTPGRELDCSGLVAYVLSAIKLALPRTAAQQAAVGTDVPRDTMSLRPGDLLTFGKGDRITHIGIYVGNGRYVHASTKAGRVIETSLDRTRSPLVRSWRGGRRVLADGFSADSVPSNP